MSKIFIAVSVAVLLCVSACQAQNTPADSATDKDIGQRAASAAETGRKEGGTEVEQRKTETGILVFDERREGTSADTVATPDDFPEAYAYGTGSIGDWNQGYMAKRMPEPEGNQTVLNTAADPGSFQALYLWEEGNAPAVTEFTEDMFGYYDEWDFRPYVTAIPMREGVEPKGSVVLLAGGAYQFRGNFTDSLTTAAALRECGFRTFVVDYRLSPYSQEEGALDVARAVRFIRKNADIYGIEPDDIAVMGFSAGGIQAGEFLMHYDEAVDGAALDPGYVPDELDALPAHASADGMIYSFYGRLSVGNMDPEWLAEGSLPPTFYVYGTQDPFYSQFEQQYQVIKDMDIPVSRIVLEGWSHGFGSDGGWVKDYADWLESVFSTNGK
ncbi:MAG: alpha/beta hydrolase [Blautia sp.]|nr:alpha/beta hydrolase [Blautia sp.]